ncbi:NfeD family protein [Anaeromicropila populeti]|uniref:Membrane protein implicated in regulation of membrane protease activity n=1 Tax=Anaeromicropila populeti TaxID=37658 RepID=A0A1I6JZG6_9FIRM|nr:NfeD family protein [Anaeromicropila populeti]SFR84341.1 Membrane protein implicated in regulation of membrane protease activity [Anaeromicropila populeti]
MYLYIWLIALAVFIIVEIATLGLATVWFACGALAAVVVTLLGGNIYVQLMVFIVVSLASLLTVRPYVARKFNLKRTKTNVMSLIGQDAKVTEDIDNFAEKGAAMINGLEWTARSETNQVISTGSKVEVVKVEGVKLIVKVKK